MPEATEDHCHLDGPARLFKALGDPTRLRMLNLLRHGELCVCDLMAVLCLPQSTARRQNKWMYYRFNTRIIDSDLSAAVLALLDRRHLQEDNQALNSHLAAKNQHSCGN